MGVCPSGGWCRIHILGGLCHRLIGHLKMLDGREEEEADLSYAESSQRIKKVLQATTAGWQRFCHLLRVIQ